MNFYEQLEQGRYGSFELKRLVGPNLLRGLIISFSVHALIVLSPYIVQLFRSDEEIPPPPIRVVDISQLTKLKSQQQTTEQVKIAAPVIAPPKAAKPVAVEEDIVEEQQLIPTQSEIATQVGASDEGLDIGSGEQIEISGNLETGDEIPEMGTFVPFEVAPQPLPTNKQPDFPELARTAGVPGKVVAQVYVDKKGEVKKWKIVKVTPEGLGFEEEVQKVITGWKFTPAIQQGNPVGVWVAVPFNFKYKK